MKIVRTLFTLVMILLTASAFAYSLGASPLPIALGLTAFSLLVPRQQNVLNFSVLFLSLIHI